MRRGGFLLVMLGAFFLTLAPLMRFYVADGVVRAPLDFYQQVSLRDEHGTYLDLFSGKVHDDTEVGAYLTVRGDVRSGTDDVAVWNTFLAFSAGDRTVRMVDWWLAMDRTSGQLINGFKGTQVDKDPAVAQSGYGLMWPVGNVQKRTYEFYDVISKRTWPMRYTGSEMVRGIHAYKYVQVVEPTKISQVTGKQWATTVGLPKKHPNVSVDGWHQATNTYWVDPRTGMPIKSQLSVNETLRTRDGKNEGTFLTADLVTEEKDVKALADRSDHYAQRIDLVRTVIPGIALVAGFVLLALGGVITLYGGGQGPKKARHANPTRPAGEVEQVPPARADLAADRRK
ncbi:DUF3068 domain-containing protein [Actinocorallia longicatena]|uniref:DUF3068 domain-containing protein n=1 Tax=Actinocorallia longicatena TaxID=111803 RepID=A0ABP6QJD1_9ACTN